MSHCGFSHENVVQIIAIAHCEWTIVTESLHALNKLFKNSFFYFYCFLYMNYLGSPQVM